MLRFVALRENALSSELRDLGELEHEVMQLVWARGSITAEQAREELRRPLKESTVRTVLRRLEDKGYVTHTVEGRTFHFVAAEARGTVAARAVQRIADWFCNGSLEEVLTGMVDNAKLSPKELQALSDKISKARERRK
jgi:BlaI family transcriptional regulator, penicillinase repressor